MYSFLSTCIFCCIVQHSIVSIVSPSQEIKFPLDTAGLESSTSHPPPAYPAPRSGASSSNPSSRNPVYDDLAKFKSKSGPHLQYADLGPRLDGGGPVQPSEQGQVKYSSLQHPPKKVEYAVLQKPPKKRPAAKHTVEAVTYVQIRPQDQVGFWWWTGWVGENDREAFSENGSILFDHFPQ